MSRRGVSWTVVVLIVIIGAQAIFLWNSFERKTQSINSEKLPEENFTAVVQKFEGNVEILSAGLKRIAKAGDRIEIGESIRTGEKSRAEIDAGTEVKVRLNPNSILESRRALEGRTGLTLHLSKGTAFVVFEERDTEMNRPTLAVVTTPNVICEPNNFERAEFLIAVQEE